MGRKAVGIKLKRQFGPDYRGPLGRPQTAAMYYFLRQGELLEVFKGRHVPTRAGPSEDLWGAWGRRHFVPAQTRPGEWYLPAGVTGRRARPWGQSARKAGSRPEAWAQKTSQSFWAVGLGEKQMPLVSLWGDGGRTNRDAAGRKGSLWGPQYSW